jgi:hypothetical protein
MEFSNKTKISADYTFTKLLCLGASGFCLLKYFAAKKIDDLYTEAWFLGIIFFLMGFAYFFSRPKVYFDNSNLYFKRIKKSEILIPFKNIHSIFYNPIRSFRSGVYFYEIEYLSEANEDEKVKFESDSPFVMEVFKNLVKKFNPSVEIV